MLEAINHPIEVLSLFRGGRIQPLRFRWRGRVYKVRRISGVWQQREGTGKVHYFSVVAENQDYFELAYDVGRSEWRICRVWMEG